jgi:SAM-dependent methyltransferase
MLRYLKQAYVSLLASNGEQRHVLGFVERALKEKSGRFKVLDVGCGYGRNLKVLRARGIDAVGVDINEEIVSANRAIGLASQTVDQFKQDTASYGVILMSHVVEHFAPADLLRFVDGYLDRLEAGGGLVIATPLLSNNFYDDFDHVRPYQPMGFQMVFGGQGAQVQYYARNRLVLRDVWFRRSPWRINYHRSRYVFGPVTRLLQALDGAAAAIFRMSFGLLGRTDGWVGWFEKIK